MHWKIVVIALMAAQVLVEVLFKRATDRQPKQKSLGVAYQFFFCSLWALALSAVIGEGIGNARNILAAAGVGALNAYGNYSNWRAYAYSLSRTALFFPLSSLIAIVLAVVILGERVLVEPTVFFGVLLSFFAMWLFQVPQKEGQFPHRRAWLFATVATVVIFGVTNYLLKPLALGGVSLHEFVVGWYGGSFIGSLTILPFERVRTMRLSRRSLVAIVILSLGFVVALSLLFVTYQYGGTLTQIIPLKGIALTILPAIIGWLYFGEKQGMGKREWWAFSLGLAGAVLILLR